MRLVLLLLPAVLAAATGGLLSWPPAVVDNQNLAANGSFESATGGWADNWTRSSASQVTLSTDGGQTGSSYATITGTNGSAGYNLSQIFINPYRRVRIRFWYRTRGGDPGNSATVSITRKDWDHGLGALYPTAATGNNPRTGGCSAWTFADGSLVSIVDSGSTATFTTSVPHGLTAGNKIKIESAVRATAFNTTWTVTAVPSSTAFQVSTGTSIADGTYDAATDYNLQVFTDGQLTGGFANWTQFCTDYVFTTSEHYKDRQQITISGTGLAAGTSLDIDDVAIEPVLQPLAIYSTYPNYRGMLWPDQGLTVKWKNIVQPPWPYTVDQLKVQVQILREADGALMASDIDTNLPAINDTIATYPHTSAIQWNGFSVSSRSYDASNLADGAYLLRATLRLKSNNSVLYTFADYRIVKEPPSAQRNGWNYWINKDNMLVKNGKPIFVWGGSWAAPSAACNTFVPGSGMLNTDSIEKISLGCAKGCGSTEGRTGCSASEPALTPWARLQGSEHNVLKTLRSVGFRMMTTYGGGWDGGSPGIACAFPCGTGPHCSSYNPAWDQVRAWYDKLNEYGIANLQITVDWNKFSSNVLSIPSWMRWNSCNLTQSEAVGKLLTLNAASPLWAHPAFAGMYMADEPPWGHRVKGAQAVFENLARWFYDQNWGGVTYYINGPDAVTMTSGWNWYMDVMGSDPYFSIASGGNSGHVYYGQPAAAINFGHPVNYHHTVQSGEAGFFARPIWTTIQVFNASRVYPFADDMKLIHIMPLAAGATGLLQWNVSSSTSGLSSATIERYAEWEYASKIIQKLLPILDTPVLDLSDGPQGLGQVITSISSNTPNAVKCSSRRLGNKVLLACTNVVNADQAVTITMAQNIGAGKVLRVWDNSVLEAAGNQFTDTFTRLAEGGTINGTLNFSPNSRIYTCTTCTFTSQLRPGDLISITSQFSAQVVRIIDDNTLEAEFRAGSSGSKININWSRGLAGAAHLYLIDLEPAAGRTTTN